MRQVRNAMTAVLLTAASAGVCMAEVVTDSIGGYGLSGDYFNVDEPINGSFDIGFSSLTAQGYVPKFNEAGAVLLSYSIFGRLIVGGAGDLTGSGAAEGTLVSAVIENAVTAAGQSDGSLDEHSELCDIPGSCTANVIVPFAFTFSDFGSVLGSGDVLVKGTGGSTQFSGSCLSPAGCDGGAYLTAWAILLDLRVEWAYCTTPGEDGCPALQPGVNSPGVNNNVPEPATVYLLAASLAGLAAARRRRVAQVISRLVA